MALSIELLHRLNSDEQPLPKRLKLAENAFHAVDLPVMRREDLILQWFCTTCTIDSNSWSFLKRCLKTEHLDIKVDVKSLLIQTLIQKFKEDVNNMCDDVLECCKLIVSNTGMHQYFINKPEELGLLIKSFLKFGSKHFRHVSPSKEHPLDVTLINNIDGTTLLVYNTAISIVESTMQIYKLSPMKDNLRIMFLHDILYPLCAIINHKCTDSTNRLGAVAHKCVQQLIFGKKYVQNKILTGEEHTDGFKELLLILAEHSKTKQLHSNITTFVFVLRAAIGVYKSDSIMLDFIFRGLVESAGVHKKEILCSFLKHLNDVTFDFDNKVNDVTLLEYCCNVIDAILLSNEITGTDYRILTQLSYFNPIIIEKRTQEILKNVFLEDPIPEYKNLIIALSDASTRLRREEKLISHVLMALKYAANKTSNTKFHEFFPQEFKDKIRKSMNTITSTQRLAILKTLVFHLNTDCMQVLQSNDLCKNILIIKATVELLVALLEGSPIFEYTGALTSHQKFVNALDDLGNVLSLLIDKALHLNHNKKLIVLLLTAISVWLQVQDALRYYVPKTVTQEITFPISEDHWQQMIQRITNFGKENCKDIMNKLILHRLKISQSTTSESHLKLSGLIGGLEYFWKFILRYNPDIISCLSNNEMAKMTSTLLMDMTLNDNNFSYWAEILSKDCLQENKTFVISLLNSVLIQIGNLAAKGVTKATTKYLDTTSLIESETIGCDNVKKIVENMKNEMSRNEWMQLQSTASNEIEMTLKTLLHIPLIFFNADVRLVTFMVIYALREECNENEKIIFLCDTIFSDLLEKPGIDMFQYIDPLLFLEPLTEAKVFQRIVEQSIRNISSYGTIKNLITYPANCKETMNVLLECIENVKPKLNVEQKTIFKKAERKLNKSILKTLTTQITKANDARTLTMLLKISIANKKVDEDLKNLVKSTLSNIFVDNINMNDKNINDLEASLELAVVVLRSQKRFDISNETIKGIWRAMFKHPSHDLLLVLLESSEPKKFHELLGLLHAEMVKNLIDMKEDAVENIFIIWHTILKIDMSAERNKLRLAMLNRLLQAIQLVHIPEKCWPKLLKLLHSIVAAKHLHLPGCIVDMSIHLGLRSVEEVLLSACNDALSLCAMLVKYRTILITDRLHILLMLYRRVLNILVHTSKTVTDKSEEHMLRCLMLDIEKFTSSLVKLKKDMVRLSPYLIADLLKLFSEASVTASVKSSVQNCVGQLISICDRHGIALLSRTLPASMQEIFKSQLDTFNKFYKFSGKI